LPALSMPLGGLGGALPPSDWAGLGGLGAEEDQIGPGRGGRAAIAVLLSAAAGRPHLPAGIADTRAAGRQQREAHEHAESAADREGAAHAENRSPSATCSVTPMSSLNSANPTRRSASGRASRPSRRSRR